MKRVRTQAEEVLDKIEFLFKGYSNEVRAQTQPYQLERARTTVTGYIYQPDDVLVRETLMEHIGSVPMVATTIYPFIQDPDVDLGKALTMLAVHDIGDLIVGDQITFTKSKDNKNIELEGARKLLDPYYHELYEDVEYQYSNTGKFAKSIDKITPDILDYLTPADITIWRFRYFLGMKADDIVELIIKHKRPYMVWNPFMTELHILICERIAAQLAKVQSS